MAKTWSKEEEQFLSENYEKMSNIELAEKFGVTPKAISHKMKRLRERTEEEQQQERKSDSKTFENATTAEDDDQESLLRIQPGEKTVQIDGKKVVLVSTGYMIKTEDGWAPVMMRKSKISS
ncbi:MAG: hypothetical protein ONB05_08880 [candidate division KSB1 bacterium]|nr:hypothetical protein [candidate division KSB1 bacterium]